MQEYNKPVDALIPIISRSINAMRTMTSLQSDNIEATNTQMVVVTKPLGERSCCLQLTFDKSNTEQIEVRDGAARLLKQGPDAEIETATATSRPVLIFSGSLQDREFLPIVEAYLSENPLFIGLMSLLHHNEVNLARLRHKRSADTDQNRKTAVADIIKAIEEYDRELRKSVANAVIAMNRGVTRRLLLLSTQDFANGQGESADREPFKRKPFRVAETHTEDKTETAEAEQPPRRAYGKRDNSTVERYCEHCGKRYVALVRDVAAGKRLTCSLACSYANRSKKTRDQRVATLKRLAEERAAKKQSGKPKKKTRKNKAVAILRPCNCCGKNYKVFERYLAQGKRLTCSLECSYNYRFRGVNGRNPHTGQPK